MRTLNHLTAYHVGPRRLRWGPVASVDDPRSAESKNWIQVTHSPRLRIAVFAMALGLQSQSFKGPVGWQSQSQAVPQPS